jgi:hypothetical protein
MQGLRFPLRLRHTTENQCSNSRLTAEERPEKGSAASRWRGRGGGEAAHSWRGMQRGGGAQAAQSEGERREVATRGWRGVGGLETLEKVVGGSSVSSAE